jgi:hypothetical protein
MSTGRGGLQAGLLLGLACVALFIAGCGGGSSSTSSSSSTEAKSSAEPSAQFLKPKGKNTIPRFGEEASTEEREAANTVVVESLKARETGDFATQCETLNQTGIKEVPNAKNQKGCPAALKKFAEPLSSTKEIRKDTLSGSIAALRVKGDQGYALYHGNDGKNYALPLGKENGTWKVSSVNTIEI